MRFPSHYWAVILGGSSGFGLATAQKLAEHGMNCFVVHRDRRGAMVRIEPDFARIRAQGVSLVSMNVDALDPAVREECLARLAVALGPDGRVRVLLHSIALGNLKLLLPERARERPTLAALAAALGVDAADLAAAANRLFGEGFDPLAPLTDSPAYPSSAGASMPIARAMLQASAGVAVSITDEPAMTMPTSAARIPARSSAISAARRPASACV